ncbi:hypothetical protein V2J09_018660 [Rumex salicifolius]
MATAFRLGAATSLSTPTYQDSRRVHAAVLKSFPDKNGSVFVRSPIHVAGGSKLTARRVDGLVTSAVASKAEASESTKTGYAVLHSCTHLFGFHYGLLNITL